MATYGPGIDQSQHAKSVSHIIKEYILPNREAFSLGTDTEGNKCFNICPISE